jgi:hypothetical protein
MSTLNGQRNHPPPALFRHIRAGAEWLRSIRRQRSARVMARNARWVSEARRTPSVSAQ